MESRNFGKFLGTLSESASTSVRFYIAGPSTPDKQTLTDEVAAWQNNRNKKNAKAEWHFTTADARVKLKRLYPAM